MSIINAAALYVAKTYDAILKSGLELAAALDLPVDTWAAGDPTRSLYKHAAEVLAKSDSVIAEFVKSAWLSVAEDEWLEVLASETFGVDVVQATYATPTVTLHNAGGGYFEIGAGKLIVSNSETNKTYHNTSTGILSAGVTLTFDLVADEAGSDSSVGANEIDTLVTTMLGVEIVSSTVGLANDKESPAALKERCLASRGALSPNGPADAYEFVALSPDLTGLTSINRARATGNNVTGAVTVRIATPSGAADSAAVAAVQAAILRWATPICITPTTVSADVLSVSLNITVYKAASLSATNVQISDAIEFAIVKFFSEVRIGGESGEIAESLLKQTIHNVYPGQIAKVTGLSDITLTASQVPVLTAINVTVS